MSRENPESRLVFCKDCVFWKRGFKTKYHGTIDWEGVYNRPYEAKVVREEHDFCSRGRVRKDKEDEHA